MAEISLCMIVRDERETLARCLDSVKEAVDEIIIVDTGSKDETREIARRYTPHVYDFFWKDDFSAARNESFAHATRDFLMWLDADDVVENAEALVRFKRDVLDHYDCVTLAEAPMVSPRQALKYIDEKRGQMDMMIQFQSMCADCLYTDYAHTAFSLRRLKRVWDLWQRKLRGKAWNMLYLENHDHPRVISRYGSEQYREQSGKALAAAYLFQQGTPFVYQGQEIGMTNWRPAHTDMYEDVQSRNFMPRLPEKVRLRWLWLGSRDSARTPMQWDDTVNAGFTAGTPWFYVNDNYREINVEAQEHDPDSLLNFYRRAIALRKRLPVVREGKYRDCCPLAGSLYLYTREMKGQRLLVACSFTERPLVVTPPKGYDFSKGRLVLQNYPVADPAIPFCTRPYETRVYLFEE